jgi:hypothetical protein
MSGVGRNPNLVSLRQARLDTFRIKEYTSLACFGRANEANLMASNGVFRSVLLASGVLLMAACASQPASTTGSLDEKYFQREANNYLKFQHEGQTVYCQNDRWADSLVPHNRCITESALRQQVENFRRSRNTVGRGGPQHVATVPGGSGS